MDTPNLTVTAVTVMTPDPRATAAFYSRLLDRPISAVEGPAPGEPEEAGWVLVRAPEGSGETTLNFEYEREWRPPAWPAEPGRQTATQHLDIRVRDLEAAVEQALAAGARLAPFQPQDDVRVMFDPVGHPFCLFVQD
ncbi:VOC family protein [Glycomyces tarimensis]